MSNDFLEESEHRCYEYFKDSETTSKYKMKLHFQSFLRTELTRFAQELEKTVNKLTAQKGGVYGEWMIGRDAVVSLIRGSLNK